MKLILIPGMDGTGEMLEEFANGYPSDFSIFPLPEDGTQNHKEIAEVICKQFPNDDFILLLESFSGGLAPHLIDRTEHLKGIIFVASFISCPNAKLVTLAQLLPLKVLVNLSWLRLPYKYLFFEQSTCDQMIEKFLTVINELPSHLLRKRLASLQRLKLPTSFQSSIPSIYIRPTNDKLVKAEKMNEILSCFENCKKIEVSGPHFVLQSNPLNMAKLIHKEILHISKV